ncbi:hypothetical protein OB08_05550 [Microbacterium sp. HJ5]
MANLFYGAGSTPIEIPDHLLAHVKIVIATKLRRNESFLMSWPHPDGSGRTSIWLQPSIPMRFVFSSSESAEIDRALLARLAESANSNTGLALTAEEMADTQRARGAVAVPDADSERSRVLAVA